MIKWSGTKELNAKLKKILQRTPQAKRQFLAQEAEILKARVKKLTPADTGILRGGWHSSEPSSDSVDIYNNTEYAPHVEFGHRQFVYGKDTGRITPGQFMLRDAVAESQEKFVADANAILGRLLNA